MNRKELSEKIAQESGLTKRDAASLTKMVFEQIAQALAAGNRVQIPGFGTFEPKQRNPRVCVNPRTKERITVPACKAPAFKVAQDLKERMNR